MTLCSCGQLTWPIGARAIWSDGTLHAPDVCMVTDGLFEAPSHEGLAVFGVMSE